MKNPILRLIIFSLLLTLVVCLVVVLIGLIFRWDSSVNYSNGLFWAGSILITLGVLSVLGGYGIRSRFDVQYAQSAGDMSLGERTKRWVSDMTQGYNMLVIFLISGVLTVGISVLVGSLIH